MTQIQLTQLTKLLVEARDFLDAYIEGHDVQDQAIAEAYAEQADDLRARIQRTLDK